MDKKSLSERDICTKFITPAIEAAGWDKMTQLLEEVDVTNGPILAKGKKISRGPNKRADYVLFYKPNIPIAIVEAKNNKHSVGDGMQQALAYAELYDVPYAFSSNGDAFLLHDRTGKSAQVETELALNEFPSPEELWQNNITAKEYDADQVNLISQDYYSDGSGKSPRYYQLMAINKTIEAIARGNDRLLLVMATGTGKTYTAFQIIWRLWKARKKKRILFLADRNILVNQTKNDDFKPFGSAMTKITKRTVDKSYEIYLSLYQAVTGAEEEKNIYKQFSPDFFDLIVVDECHRGSASADSAWREILEYFSSATQIGLTATPKETKEVSNSEYFGEPVFTYSLKQGIADGFLAPYRVMRVDLDKDLQGWRPEVGQTDKHGELIEDRIYNQRDFDKTIVLEKRTKLVAQKVTDFLKSTDRYAKTIVFCEDIDHAERMRQALVNANPDLVQENSKYVMRITGDSKEGKAQLDNFIHPAKRYPVIATTSKLLSTGVNAQTCKLIVLDQRIQSMTEFKQRIGRGTRINEDYDKYFFTIMDFRNATELFADPEFDGEPMVIFDPASGGEDGETNGEEKDPKEKQKKYYVADVEVSVLAERVQYLDQNGKLITESLRDYTRKTVLKEFSSLDSFLQRWEETDRKTVVFEELQEQGVLLAALEDEIGKEYDPFDLVCHVVFDQPPLTRHERANNVKKKDYFSKYGEVARNVLKSILEKYADQGIDLEDLSVLKVAPFSSIGTPIEILDAFGGRDGYLQAIRELETLLFSVA
ncbi:MAG: DEAD/DEAH box helicase family protein [Opitutae bacterium]